MPNPFPIENYRTAVAATRQLCEETVSEPSRDPDRFAEIYDNRIAYQLALLLLDNQQNLNTEKRENREFFPPLSHE